MIFSLSLPISFITPCVCSFNASAISLTLDSGADAPAVIMGESEVKENKFTLKNLKSSKENDQKTVTKESLVDEIKKIT